MQLYSNIVELKSVHRFKNDIQQLSVCKSHRKDLNFTHLDDLDLMTSNCIDTWDDHGDQLKSKRILIFWPPCSFQSLNPSTINVCTKMVAKSDYNLFFCIPIFKDNNFRGRFLLERNTFFSFFKILTYAFAGCIPYFFIVQTQA